MDRGDEDHTLTARKTMFVIFAQTAIPPKPGQGALDNPPSRQDVKAFLFRIALDDIENGIEMLVYPLNELTSVGSIGPNSLEMSDERIIELGKQQFCPIAILDTGGMNHNLKYVTDSVDENMPLSALNSFSSVIAPFTTCFRCFDTLAVDNGSAWLRLSFALLPLLLAQPFIDAVPGTIHRPLAKVVVDTVEVRKVMRQIFPLAAGSIDIEDGVDHCSHLQFNWPSRAVVFQW